MVSEEEVERIKEWQNGKSPGPYSLEIHPTSNCNLNCIMCGSYNKETEYISLSHWLRALKSASRMNVREVAVCGGGEPLFYQGGLQKIIEVIKDEGMEGSLTTNGTLLQEDQIRKLVEIGWEQIIFSIDAPKASVHDEIRGREGTFAKILDNVKKINLWKDKLNKKNPRLDINMVLMNKNYQMIGEMIKFAADLNFSVISFQVLLQPPIPDWSGDLSLGEEDKQHLRENLGRYIELADEYGVETNLSELKDTSLIDKPDKMFECLEEDKKEGKKSLYCCEPWTSMIIRPDGRVGPCPQILERSDKNIQDHPLEELWRGEFFGNVREEISRGNLSEYCENCCSPKIIQNLRLKRKLNG